MTYIDSSDLILEVINEMPSYFETNKVDESILYPVLRKCMDTMGVGINEEAPPAILEVRGFKADLPRDFKIMCLAMSCIGKTYTRPVPNIGTITKEVGVCEIGECDTFKVHVDDCGKMTKIVQQLPYESFSWNDYELLSVQKESMPFCDQMCPNNMSDNSKQITIKNGQIIANFEIGIIYLEYIKDNNTATGVKIPDNGSIIEWIKNEMKLRILTVLYTNGEPNIEGRLGVVKNDTFVSMEQARPIWKRSEFGEFYNLRNVLARRYNARARPMIDDTYSRSKYR